MMADSIDRVFAHALQTVRKIPRSGSARPPASDRLKLYGLYKQSMEGDVVGVMDRPGGGGGGGSTYPDPDISPLARQTSSSSAYPGIDTVINNNNSSNTPASYSAANPSSGELSGEEKAEQEKYDAWASCAGLSCSAAKCRYIDALITTMRTYAYGTPEARELVNELEFVWEQVKGNSEFHEEEENASGGSLGKEEDQVGLEGRRTKEGLRVLRPMSDLDDGEGADREDKEEEDELGVERRRKRGQPRGGSWQGRVDKALVQMTAEIAALREVMEARGMRIWGGRSRRRTGGFLGWILGRLWALVKRAVVDALILVGIWMAFRWNKGGKEMVLKVYRRIRREVEERTRDGVGRNLLR